MAQQLSKVPVLKNAYTDPVYQSTFLPIIEKAEIKIKELVLVAFLFNQNKYFLRLAVSGVIAAVSKKLPVDLVDRETYLNSLVKKSEYYILRYYDQPLMRYGTVRKSLMNLAPQDVALPKIENPKQLYDFISSRSMWGEAKGYPNVMNYPKEIKQYIFDFGGDPFTTISTDGKKPISLWQKAELDVRYNNQMQMLQNLRVEGVELAWTSSHPNASKRCAPWQGKLMRLEGHATMSGFRMGKVDGHWVYSLTDIMAQTDKYGYHNNIICGFNCRHHLIPYKGQTPPTEYTKEEVAKQREIETKIRNLETKIRRMKKDLVLFEKLGDKATVRALKAKIKETTLYYQRYCEKNGYAYYKYRIDI